MTDPIAPTYKIHDGAGASAAFGKSFSMPGRPASAIYSLEWTADRKAVTIHGSPTATDSASEQQELQSVAYALRLAGFAVRVLGGQGFFNNPESPYLRAL